MIILPAIIERLCVWSASTSYYRTSPVRYAL